MTIVSIIFLSIFGFYYHRKHSDTTINISQNTTFMLAYENIFITLKEFTEYRKNRRYNIIWLNEATEILVGENTKLLTVGQIYCLKTPRENS